MADIFEVDLEHGFNILMNVNITVVNKNKYLRKDKTVECLLNKVSSSGSFEAARFINMKLDHAVTFLENITPISKKLETLLQELLDKRPEQDVKIFHRHRMKAAYPNAFHHTEPSPLAQRRFGGAIRDIDFVPKKVRIIHARHVGSDSRFPKQKNHKFNDRMRDFYSQLDHKKEMVESQIIDRKQSINELKRKLNHKRMNFPPPTKSLKLNFTEQNEADDPLDDLDFLNEDVQGLINTHQSLSSLQNIVNQHAELPPEIEPVFLEDDKEFVFPEPPEQTDKDVAEQRARKLRKWFHGHREEVMDTHFQKWDHDKMAETPKTDLELFHEKDNFEYGRLIKVEKKIIEYKDLQKQHELPDIQDDLLKRVINLYDTNTPQTYDMLRRMMALKDSEEQNYTQSFYQSAAKNPHLVKALRETEKLTNPNLTPEESSHIKKEAMRYASRAKPTERKSFYMTQHNLDFIKGLKLPTEGDMKDLHGFMKREEYAVEQNRLLDLEKQMKAVSYDKDYFKSTLQRYWKQEKDMIQSRVDEEELGADNLSDTDQQYHAEMVNEIKKDQEELEKAIAREEQQLEKDPSNLYKKYSHVLFNRASVGRVWDHVNNKLAPVQGTKKMPARTESDAYHNSMEKLNTLQLLLEQKPNFGSNSSNFYNKEYLDEARLKPNAYDAMKKGFHSNLEQHHRLDTFLLDWYSDNFANPGEKSTVHPHAIIDDLVDTLATLNKGTVKEQSVTGYKKLLRERHASLTKVPLPLFEHDVYHISPSNKLEEVTSPDLQPKDWLVNPTSQHRYFRYRQRMTPAGKQFMEKITAQPSDSSRLPALISQIESRSAKMAATDSNVRSRLDYFRNKITSDSPLEQETASGLKKMKKDNPHAYKLAIADYKSPPELVVTNATSAPGHLEHKMLSRPIYIEPHDDIKTISHEDFNHEGSLEDGPIWPRQMVSCTMTKRPNSDHHLDTMRHPTPLYGMLQMDLNHHQDMSLEVLNRVLGAFFPNDENVLNHVDHISRSCRNFFRKCMEDMHYMSIPTANLDEFSKIMLGGSPLGHCLTDSINFSRDDHKGIKSTFHPKESTDDTEHPITHIPIGKGRELLTEKLVDKDNKMTLAHSVSPKGGVISNTAALLGAAGVTSLGYMFGVTSPIVRGFHDLVNAMAGHSPEATFDPHWEEIKINNIQNRLWESMGMRPELDNKAFTGMVPFNPATSNRFDTMGFNNFLTRSFTFLTGNFADGFVRLGVMPPWLSDILQLIWLYIVKLSKAANSSPVMVMVLMYVFRGQLLNVMKKIPKGFKWVGEKLLGALTSIGKSSTPPSPSTVKKTPTPDLTQMHATSNSGGIGHAQPEIQSFLQEMSKTFKTTPGTNLQMTTRALSIAGYPPHLNSYILQQITQMGKGKLPVSSAYGITPKFIVRDMIPKMLKAYPPFYKVLHSTNFVNSKHSEFWSSPTWKHMAEMGPSMGDLLSQTALNNHISNFQSEPVDNTQMPVHFPKRPEFMHAASVPKQWKNGVLATLFKNNEFKLEQEGLIPISPTQIMDAKTNKYFDVKRLMDANYDDLTNEERQITKNLGTALNDKLARSLFRHAYPNDENLDRNPDIASPQKWSRSRTEWSLNPEILMPVAVAPSMWNKIAGNWQSFSLDQNPNVLKQHMDEAFSEMGKRDPINSFLDKSMSLTIPTTHKSPVTKSPLNFNQKFKPVGTVQIEAQALARTQVKQLLQQTLRNTNAKLEEVSSYLTDRTGLPPPENMKKPRELIKIQASSLNQLEKLSADNPNVLSNEQVANMTENAAKIKEHYDDAVLHDVSDHMKNVEELSTLPENMVNDNYNQDGMWSNFVSKVKSWTPSLTPDMEHIRRMAGEDFDFETGTGIKKGYAKVMYAPHNTIVLHVKPNKTYTMCSGQHGGSLKSILPFWDSNFEMRGGPSDHLSYDLDNNWFHVTRDPEQLEHSNSHASFHPDQFPHLSEMNNQERGFFPTEQQEAVPKLIKLIGQLPMTQPTLMDDSLVRTYKLPGTTKLIQAPIENKLYKSLSKAIIINDEEFHTFLNLRNNHIPIHLKEPGHILPLMSFLLRPKLFV